VRVAAAVVQEGDQLLMTQRPPGGPLGGLWEFPGGKLEPGEGAAAALAREVREELGVDCTVHEVLAVEQHDYPHVAVEITFLRTTLASHSFRPSPAVHAWRWLRPAEVVLDEVLAADRDFLRALGAPHPGGPDRAPTPRGGPA
jgi:mutator protein MutT